MLAFDFISALYRKQKDETFTIQTEQILTSGHVMAGFEMNGMFGSTRFGRAKQQDTCGPDMMDKLLDAMDEYEILPKTTIRPRTISKFLSLNI